MIRADCAEPASPTSLVSLTPAAKPKQFMRIWTKNKRKLTFRAQGLSHVSAAKNAASASAFKKVGPDALYSIAIEYEYNRDIDNLGFRILMYEGGR